MTLPQQQQQQQHDMVGTGQLVGMTGVAVAAASGASVASVNSAGGGSAASSSAGGGGQHTASGGTVHHIMQPMFNERQVVRKAGRQAIRQFLEQHCCFSVLRASGKVVVFDTRIPIQLAFYALVEHDMQAAPLWDPVACQFTGLLTVTDFIDILRHYRAAGKDVASLAVTSIADILYDCCRCGTAAAAAATSADSGRGGIAEGEETTTPLLEQQQQQQQRPVVPPRRFVGADSTCTLKQACSTLQAEGCDFLPICFAEDMRVLACMTYTNILEHLVTHFREQRRLFDDSVTDLGIGTYGAPNLVTVSPSNTLAEALELMHQHNLSALPVVVVDDDDDNDNNNDDEEADGGGTDGVLHPAGEGVPADETNQQQQQQQPKQKIVGVYSRSDITFLTKATDAQDAVRNLDLTVQDILQQHRSDVTTPDALRTCGPHHTLQSIFESFAQVRFHRLYVVDARDRLLGVVSAKDLVAYFLTDDDDDNNNNNNIKDAGGAATTQPAASAAAAQTSAGANHPGQFLGNPNTSAAATATA